MKIIMLAGKGISTKFIYNALKSDVEINNVLIADSGSTRNLIKRRIKRLGLFKVLNQL